MWYNGLNKQTKGVISLQEIQILADNFKACQNILIALGDETRQHLILEMMQMGQCDGVRVGAITEKTNLSRPAVSHHLKILKDAEIINVRRDGTKNYYYFDSDSKAMSKLLMMISNAKDIIDNLPNKSRKEL